MGRVTVAVPVWFREQMTRLMGLRFAPADLTTHWEALSDVPEAVLTAAVTRAQRTRADFPTPNELRADADIVAPSSRELEPVENRAVPLDQPFTITVPGAGTVLSVTREWKYYHDACGDLGWVSWWCGEESPTPWMRVARCERVIEHAPHEWSAKCSCFDSNPALVRKRESQRRYADQAPPKGGR